MNKQKYGMTILEIMTVIVIAGIIFSIGYFIMAKSGADFRLKSGSRSLRHDIALARQYAKERGSNYGIAFDDGSWYVFTIAENGDTIIESDFEMPHDIQIGTTNDVNQKVSGTGTLPADGIDFPSDRIVFMQRAAVPGVIYLNNGEDNKAVEVNVLGNTRIYTWRENSWNQED
ncbi:MAG: Tfp pilus assembly protein FimT/FimU [Candidatus Zixiibacteriota bacterium]